MFGANARGKANWLVTFLGISGMVYACVTAAQAEYKPRASAPPPILSPDLSNPWIVQIPRSQARAVQNLERSNKKKRAQAHSNRYSRRIPKQYLPAIVNYKTSHAPGTVVIDTTSRYLYFVQGHGKARRYGVGVGRPGFEWAGVHKVTRKREWPDWRPPAEMLKRQPNLPRFMPGGPRNPLGARALYLGSTLYRIHGSNEPWTIGQAVSSGCIRMRNEDVAELYNMVPVGAKVFVR
ncbi:putative L,D-transpeptidase ErfK/SrfK precursor [Pseudovibrio axinellae]|uniref:Putative L,D-transpeptidase ErfK/SrfK n=1 Tax=Pseudovibrio axinellae TaxID=989403 RepID=A0A165T5Y4_9HYPH|nr:L,D-transpeptidase [Pseudovibrio axinellae]KZL05483.1 putative L,D-transpeptidase ErfK/SrfK precursor [Pseudovibrio axinellae]SEP97342.1 L,D-transpeptidase catalytic domain [Pseudovibrio axinellae]